MSADFEAPYEGRQRSRDTRNRRRRRSWLGGLGRLLFWTLVLAGVFVLGLGFGKTIGDGGTIAGDSVTVNRDRGEIVATLPTKTVVKTTTVVKTKTVRVARKKRS